MSCTCYFTGLQQFRHRILQYKCMKKRVMRRASELVGCTHHHHPGCLQMLQHRPDLLALLMHLLQAPSLRLHPHYRQLGPPGLPQPGLLRHVSCTALQSTVIGDKLPCKQYRQGQELPYCTGRGRAVFCDQVLLVCRQERHCLLPFCTSPADGDAQPNSESEDSPQL